MEKHIFVVVKNVYGRDTIYPHCDKAKFFAELAGTTTLTATAIAAIKRHGYTARVHPSMETL